MSTYCYRDPAGLLPDHVHIEPDGHKNDFENMGRLLKAASPPGRIEHLRRHAELATEANDLERQFNDNGKIADWRLLEAISQAERKALYLDAAPVAIREKSRHKGQKEPRGSKMPKLDAWLDDQDLSQPNKALWLLLPEGGMGDPYRDGEQACEGEQATGIDGFNKRVTAARKRKKRR